MFSVIHGIQLLGLRGKAVRKRTSDHVRIR